jgi:hypothetical protein
MVSTAKLPPQTLALKEHPNLSPFPLDLSVSSTATAAAMVPPQTLALKEHPKMIPFTSTKGPMASKSERPEPPTCIAEGPEAKRFVVATKAEDVDVLEHIWNLRALQVQRVPTIQEGKALTLLCEVLLKRWRNITTRSFLNFLDLKSTNPVIAKRDDGQYGWLTSGKKN